VSPTLTTPPMVTGTLLFGQSDIVIPALSLSANGWPYWKEFVHVKPTLVCGGASANIMENGLNVMVLRKVLWSNVWFFVF
jgi:hypothetical protein